MGLGGLQRGTGEGRSNTGTVSDRTASSTQGSSGSRDDETVLSPHTSSGTAPSFDGLPVREEKKTETLLAENHFETEASRVLFDAIDEIRSCGAGEYIHIPQLVIVGGQSTGKSSLLQSLTDIPFPVGMNTCTRFATRIVSRRTAPGTPRQVKITIVPPDFKLQGFDTTPSETYREFVQVKDSLTAEQFAVIVNQASRRLGINPGTGKHNKNFALEVLKVDISGPTRSHFSILDIPGIFSNDLSVKKNEMLGVRNMAIEYMKQPKNIVICVADAATDLMMQEIFKLTYEHVAKERLIGVFTKCDRLDKSLSERVAAIANGESEDVSQHLRNRWFVVRNRVDGDGDGDINFDLNAVEQSLFSTSSWTKVPEDRRGSANLRQYLGKLLSDKIRDEFPQLLAELQKLLGESESRLAQHGEARTTPHLQRVYLRDIARRYERWARDALKHPWEIKEAGAKVRNMVYDQNIAFGEQMRRWGHVYEFEDHYAEDKTVIKRLRKIFYPDIVDEDNDPEPLSSSLTTSNTVTPDPSFVSDAPHSPVLSKDALLEKIGEQVRDCECTALPCFVHPDVIQRLYLIQTEKWHGEAETHLRAVAATIKNAAQILLGFVVPPTTSDTVLHDGLRHIIDDLYDKALTKALASLKDYCDGDRKKLLQTTDPEFMNRLQMLQTVRLIQTLRNTFSFVNQAQASKTSVERLISDIFKGSHHSSEENTVFEVHDALKVYYQSCVKSFNHHITNTIVEDFVIDPAGPLKGFTGDFIDRLPNEEVERLGGESSEVIEERKLVGHKIKTLKAAQKTAQEAFGAVRALSKK